MVMLTMASYALAAQVWEENYSKALEATQKGDWAAARDAFKAAIANRPEDSNKPSRLSGSITDPVMWRKGAPYSPNFGAAYAAYKLGMDTSDQARKTELISEAAKEFDMLVKMNQISAETLNLLKKSYTYLDNSAALEALSEVEPNGWEIDTALMQRSDIVESTPRSVEGDKVNPETSSNQARRTAVETEGGVTMIPLTAPELPNFRDFLPEGKVPVVETKYALIIGNSETRLEDFKIDHAASDAMHVQANLLESAGYAETNVTTLTNVTASQLNDGIRAFIEALPNDATVFIYFSGVGVSVDGKDYLAGTDTEFATDVAKMVPKRTLYDGLLGKGASVFAFYQTDRSMVTGNYFGQERTLAGRLAETHSTISGQKVYSIVKEGERIGLYTNAMCEILQYFLTNQVPVGEFCWQVFYRMRRGEEVLGGGGSYQTPTLPRIINMPEDAKF